MKNKKIFIAGHTGLVGKTLTETLARKGYKNLLTISSKDLDLKNSEAVNCYIGNNKPDIIIVAAGKIGGINLNISQPADMLYQNTMMWANLINSADKNNIEKLIFLGSSAIYSENSQVPYKEEYLFNNKPDDSVIGYAYSKIYAMIYCEQLYKLKKRNYYTLTLSNLYGPNDHFNENNAHLVPSLIYKIYNAKISGKNEVVLWGTGKPTRDLLYVHDLVNAIEFSINNIDAEKIYGQGISHLNVGTGNEYSIAKIAELISKTLEFEGDILFDTTRPDGVLRKSVDISRIAKLGWKPTTEIENGIRNTCEYFLNNIVK